LTLGSVDVGNDTVGLARVSLSSLFVNRSKIFAVSAPRSVKFNQNVLVLVEGDFVKVAAVQHSHRSSHLFNLASNSSLVCNKLCQVGQLTSTIVFLWRAGSFGEPLERLR